MSDPNDTQPGDGTPTTDVPTDVPVEGTPVEGARVEGRRVDGRPVEGEGTRVEGAPADASGAAPRSRASQLQELVDEPAKVMRIGTMLKQLLDEVKSAPLDNAARIRLAEIHERSIKELEDGLAPELVQELERIHLPFPEDGAPSDAELRIAQAQLVGWLEGLFHGIQAAMAAQHAAREHAAAQMQLRQLPPGTMIAPGVIIGENGEPRRAAEPRPGVDPAQPADPDHGPGQYL